MAFDVTNLVACIFVVYGCFGLAQSKTGKMCIRDRVPTSLPTVLPNIWMVPLHR